MKTGIIALLLAFTPAFAEEKKHEVDYSAAWCEEHGGVAEFKLFDNARIDCLTDNLAVEHDWAKGAKPYECVGQALYYGAVSGRVPVCVLIRTEGQELDDFTRSVNRAIIGGGSADVEVWCIDSTGESIDCLTGK